MRCADIVAILDKDGQLIHPSVVVATDDATCTGSQYVLLLQSELDLYTASPFRLSVADGAALSGLIIAVWACALYGRALIRSLFSDAGSTS